MNIEVIAESAYQRRIRVTIPAERVRSELDKAYRQLGKRARLRGFRPGKAPRKVLEARFGPQVASDVASDLIQQAYTDAIAQHSLEPVSRPSVDRQDDPAANRDFSFDIEVEVKPSVELDTWTGVDVVYPDAQVADDELERAVQARLDANKRLVEVTDRPVEVGDQVMVELHVKDGDDEVATEPGTMVQTTGDTWYAGIEDFLVGVEKDAEKTGEVTFSGEARVESVQGRTLQVQAKVLSIQAYETPELTDEAAEELGFEGGVEGMRQAVRAELQSGRDELARNQARANLLQALIDANPFEVPAGMVDQQLDVLMNELRLQQAYRGVDPRQVHFSEAQIADLRARSTFAVKGGIILDFVQEREDIQVTDDDVERRIASLAEERGQDPESLRGYFEREDSMDELRARILEEKTLDWLLEHANIVEPSEDEAAAEDSEDEAPAYEAPEDDADASDDDASGEDASDDDASDDDASDED
jgi:trigger factor